MISRGKFVGDMQHLLLLSCRLEEFLSGRLLAEMATHAAAPPPAAGGERGPAPSYTAYLAQCPVSAAAPGGDGSLQPGPLHALAVDVPLPGLLQGARLAQVNFWASLAPARSSCHYDPYSNILCVAAGSKTVRLLPPSATGLLSAQPVFHESANHSPADLAAPDLAAALPLLQTFTLQPGDALFIPEGWWHQVESGAHTLAVNCWWESAVSAALGTPTDAFYLRRLAQSLLEQEKVRALAALERLDLAALLPTPEVHGQLCRLQQEDPAWNAGGWLLEMSGGGGTQEEGGQELKQQALSSRLEGGELAALGALLACVDAVLASLAAQGVEPLMRVLLVLRRRRPAATARLLLAVLGPAAWELITAVGERAEAGAAAAGAAPGTAEALVQAFFDELYSAVGEDRQGLLDVILERKEALARACLAEALRGALSLPGLAL
eukprot:scaffold1.g5405.t1